MIAEISACFNIVSFNCLYALSTADPAARGEVGSASSKFFICIGDQPGLDYGQPRNADGQGFAAFGRVVRGMEAVRAINAAATINNSDSEYTQGQIIADPVEILSAIGQ